MSRSSCDAFIIGELSCMIIRYSRKQTHFASLESRALASVGASSLTGPCACIRLMSELRLMKFDHIVAAADIPCMAPYPWHHMRR